MSRDVRLVEGRVAEETARAGVGYLHSSLHPTTTLGSGRAVAILAGPDAGAGPTAGWTQPVAGAAVEPRFWILDIPPDSPDREAPPLHATPSTDFGFVLEGEIILEVGGGERATLHQGDAFIQRGADHRWLNHSGRIARIGLVLIQAP